MCTVFTQCDNTKQATHKFFAVLVEDVLQTMYRQEKLQLNFISYYNYLVMKKEVSANYKVHRILNVVCKLLVTLNIEISILLCNILYSYRLHIQVQFLLLCEYNM